MSHAARKQFGLNSDHLTVKNKNAHLPLHDLCVGQDVMFQESIDRRRFPATIISLCEEPRIYKIATKDGVIYRKTQAHLKPYKPQNKQCGDEHSIMKSVICRQLNM